MSETAPAWWEHDVLDRDRWGEFVEPVLQRFVRARDKNRLPHAVLLVGPPGLGRELAAVEASIMLVCADHPGPWTDSRCAKRVRRGIHPDVVAMRSEGRGRIITIGAVRKQIVEVVAVRPYEGQQRVWIIDGVEEGSFPGPTANALLKSLEEPPDHATFILLASNPEAVLPTIRSRCQQLNLPGVVSMAKTLAPEGEIPELAASSLEPTELNKAAADIRKALNAGLQGEVGPLVRLPYRVPAELPPFAAVASVALEMGCDEEANGFGDEMARLATDLLAAERRARALNLNPKNQIISCLMQWYRELDQC